MAETKIEWTATVMPDGTSRPGFTFNPWVGCTKVSGACDHCYAESWAKRAGHPELWTGERRRTSEKNWNLPRRWDRQARLARFRAKVFCASLADVFDNQAHPDWRADLWALIADTPDLDWLLLTKRPQNIAKMLPGAYVEQLVGRDLPSWPWPNVWLGTTTENQEEADRRIPHLLDVPAVVHFLSCEPLLGPLDLTEYLTGMPRVDWVICGGESGPGRRPIDLGWARMIRDDCASSSVPYFFKQVDKVQPIPEDLQVRQTPSPEIVHHAEAIHTG